MPAGQHARAGLLYGLGAYAWWGFAPAYFKALTHVSAATILGHRIVWSVLLLILLVSWARQWVQVRAIARSGRAWLWLGASTILIAVNWFVFIYSIATGRLVESSLGYFINPLVSVLLGMVFLGERLRAWQWVAAAVAAAGVAYLSIAQGKLPWIAVTLACSFGLYGLIRKQAPAGPLVGLFFETALLAPVACAFLAWSHTRPAAEAYNTMGTLGLLSLAGVITTVPLLWFAASARRLRLVTIGFLQYITPTLHFLTAVLFFGESFGRERVIAFVCIWSAVAIFVVDSALNLRRCRVFASLPSIDKEPTSG